MMYKKNSTYIIAEIGINHEGNFSRAVNLIKAAKRSGVNAVKFQVFKPETLAREKSKKTTQQKKLTSKTMSLAQMWKKMALNYLQLKKLKKLSKDLKLDFICSVFDEESLDLVTKLQVDTIKIASSDITDHNLLKLIKKRAKKIIFSTGLSTESEIRQAVKILGNRSTILHCVSSYPCPQSLANLARIKTLKNKFKNSIGYSDHTIGNESCYMAIMFNASIIEKHFTLNKKMQGADHLLSADENDMREIVSFAKSKNILQGNGFIQPTKHELKNRKFFRKGVYYKNNFMANHLIKKEDIFFARPETKLKLNNYKKIIGKKLKTKKIKFTPMSEKDYY